MEGFLQFGPRVAIKPRFHSTLLLVRSQRLRVAYV